MHPHTRLRFLAKLWTLVAFGFVWSSAAKAAPLDPSPTTRPVSRSGPSGAVFLKLNTLHGLLPRARKTFAPGIVPQEATYEGELRGKQLRIQAKIRVHVLKRGVVRWDLGGAGGVILRLQVNRKSTAPFRNARGRYSVLLHPGGNEVTYHYLLPVRPQRGGKHSLALDLPAVSRAHMTLRFAGDGWELTTSPAARIKTVVRSGKTRFGLDLPATGRILLLWKGKRIVRKVRTRFRAKVETLLTLQEGLMAGTSRLSVQLLTGSLRSLGFKAPRSVEVLTVQGAAVTEWYQTRQDARWRWYKVQLSRAVKERHTLRLRFERTKLKTDVPVRLLSPVVSGAEALRGTLGVLAKADTEVSHHKSTKATTLDVRSLSPRIRKLSDRPILLAYRFAGPDFGVQVKVTRHKQVKVLSILVNRALFQTVLTPQGREVVRATYQVTNNQRQFMQVDLPGGARLLGTFVAGQPVQPARSSRQPGAGDPSKGGLQRPERYLIPLIRSSGQRHRRSFQVELFYTRKRAEFRSRGKLQVVLPRTPLEIMKLQWQLYTPSQFPVLWTEGNVRSSRTRRFLTRLGRRVVQDLRSATPDLWAGGRSRRSLNVYNKLGLKERFARPRWKKRRPSRARWRHRNSPSDYRSNFALKMRQLRLEFPLQGTLHAFRGHLFRGKAPRIELGYVRQSTLQIWCWIVLGLSLLLGFMFARGLFFHPLGIRWGQLFSIVLLWGGFCGVGFLIPLTYLGLFRGALFGFWVACLLRLSKADRSVYRFPSVYLTLARWWAVSLTFLMLLVDNPGAQLTCLLLAIPIYPALLLRKPEKEAESWTHTDEEVVAQ